MLNLDETLSITSYYIIQRDFYLKAFLYSFCVIIFIDITRSQVSEIDLLQLIPGFYLILLFISLIFLISLSDFFFRFSFEIDNNKGFGIKTINKIQYIIILKSSVSLIISAVLIALNTIVPLSFDSFNTYGEKTVENLWSFNELLTLEIVLLLLLIVLLQLPLVGMFFLTTERDLSFLPEFWKIISLSSFLFAGLLTPTIDGYTQLSFAALAISIYLWTIFLIEKRITVKFPGLNGLI